MLLDEPKIFFLERRYFFSIILSEFLKNRVALQLRREKGMTQKELAATLYVSDKAVSKWERGESLT